VGGLSGDGSLGLNFLTSYDLEVDSANSKVSLHRQYPCDDAPVYWTDHAVEIPFTMDHGIPMTSVVVNGQRMRAVIDTGASGTVMDLAAAQGLGVGPSSQGVVGSGEVEHGSGEKTPAYRYRFQKLTFSGITFENADVVLTRLEGYDLIIGMPQLKQLRMYFAFRKRKIYATEADAK
jgi:predicted aspartyl protease